MFYFLTGFVLKQLQLIQLPSRPFKTFFKFPIIFLLRSNLKSSQKVLMLTWLFLSFKWLLYNIFRFILQDGEFTEASAAGNFSVPDSCCKTEKPGCGSTIHPSNIHYTVRPDMTSLFQFRLYQYYTWRLR